MPAAKPQCDVAVYHENGYVVVEVEPVDRPERTLMAQLTPDMARDMAILLTKASIAAETSAQK